MWTTDNRAKYDRDKLRYPALPRLKRSPELTCCLI